MASFQVHLKKENTLLDCSESTIRHVYLFGPGVQMHPEDPRMKKLQDDKEVQDAGLTIVINKMDEIFLQ